MSAGKGCPTLYYFYKIGECENVRLNGEAVVTSNYPEARICTDKCRRKECWYVENEKDA